MKVNQLEFIAMNNPLRAFIQDRVEGRLMREMAPVKEIGRALEIGCGQGVGAGIIKKYFRPGFISAVDLDRRMIDLAVRRNKDTAISFEVQDASCLNFPDESFDAVFDFGIIHHIPDWMKALGEIRRVLKNGGWLIMDDLSIETFETVTGRAFRMLSVHPYEKMYRVDEFINHLGKIGLEVKALRKFNPFGLLKIFMLYARLKK
jgi:ubiquinone/menaquinone biosynthesis C-methylase UbiE